MMESIDRILNIPTVESKTNFWMIRAKRGFFFDEYVSEGYIAIGWNSITKAMLSNDLTRARSDALKESIRENYNESRPGTALNKCLRFCNELKPGDIAVIVDNNRVAFAYIGEYYEEDNASLTVALEKEIHSQIERANPATASFNCPYRKRRKITIIRVLREADSISPYLQNAIARNWHSLSNLNEYSDLVLSGCFDAVVFGDKLTVTFRVGQQGDINALDLAHFVLYAATIISDERLDDVSVKTTLHSPGDVILQVCNFVFENALPLALLYLAIFGGKVGDYELNSIIGIVKRMVNRKYEKDKQKLELKRTAAEIALVEQQAISEELSNIERIKDLRLNNIDTYANPLAQAAKNLDLQPSQSTIIDLTQIIKEHSDKSRE